MKRILFILFCLFAVTSQAQKMPDAGLNKVRISAADKTVVADIDPVSSTPVAKDSLFYYWYGSNEIHITQSGFSGKLLNGGYTEYYPNKNLKEQGMFKKGLKNGVWKSWNRDGQLLTSSNWKNGVQLSNERRSVWRKLNIFKKRKKQAQADTLKKSGN